MTATDVPGAPRGGAAFGSVLAVHEAGKDPDGALAVAADIARAGGDRLAVVSVASAMSETELARFARATGRDLATVKADLAAKAERAVADAARRVCPDIEPAIEIVFGKPFIEIIRRVIAGGHGLVVKTAEELGGRLRHLLASTDQHLLRKCPAPVLLHRDGARTLEGPVVACVDVEGDAAAEPETEAALNRAIVAVAVALAIAAEAPVRIVSVWGLPAEGLVRMYGDDGLQRYVDEVERQHARDLNRLVEAGREQAGAAGAAVSIAPHLVRGTPRSAIPEAIAGLGARLVVMGTVARTGVPGLIIGNTAEDILNQIETSVVAVKPPGYTSPLAA